MLTNDELFWAFVVYDMLKSVLFLGLGIKWGFDYGLKNAGKFIQSAVKPPRDGNPPGGGSK